MFPLGGLDAAGPVVAGAGGERLIREVALDLPALAADRDIPAERPGALVGVLRTLAVEPAGTARVGERLAQLVAADVRDRREPLAVNRARILRVAAGVAVELEEERELHRRRCRSSPSCARRSSPHCPAGCRCRPGSTRSETGVTCAAASAFCTSASTPLVPGSFDARRRRVSGRPLVGHRVGDVCAARLGVLEIRVQVRRAAEPAIERGDAGDLVACVGRPARSPIDRFDNGT